MEPEGEPLTPGTSYGPVPIDSAQNPVTPTFLNSTLEVRHQCIYIYIYIEKYILKNLYIYVVISAAIFTPINNKFFVYCYYFLVFMFSKSERWPDICQMLVGPHWGGALQAEWGPPVQCKPREERTEEIQILSLSFLLKLGLWLWEGNTRW